MYILVTTFVSVIVNYSNQSKKVWNCDYIVFVYVSFSEMRTKDEWIWVDTLSVKDILVTHTNV